MKLDWTALRRRGSCAFLVASTLLADGHVAAQEPAAAATNESQPDATALLKSMADYLAGLEFFRCTTTNGYETVQPNGQKVEFGETREIFLARPNRLRVEEVASDGFSDVTVFDGREITVVSAGFNVFAQAPQQWRLAFFVGISLLALGIVVSFFRKLAPGDRLSALALGLISGGAVGNLIDRIRAPHEVIDFLHDPRMLTGEHSTVTTTKLPNGAKRLKYEIGPFKIIPGQNEIGYTPITAKPKVDGYITRMKPDLIYMNGTVPRVDVVHLHHGVWVNLSRQNTTNNLPELFFAAGEEKTIFQLPKGYGYHYKATDDWLFNHMIHNLTPTATQVKMVYEIDFIPDSSAAAKKMKPALMMEYWENALASEGSIGVTDSPVMSQWAMWAPMRTCTPRSTSARQRPIVDARMGLDGPVFTAGAGGATIFGPGRRARVFITTA